MEKTFGFTQTPQRGKQSVNIAWHGMTIPKCGISLTIGLRAGRPIPLVTATARNVLVVRNKPLHQPRCAITLQMPQYCVVLREPVRGEWRWIHLVMCP